MAKTMSLPRGQTPYDRDRVGTSRDRRVSRGVAFGDLPEGYDQYFRPKARGLPSTFPPLTGVAGGWGETKRLFYPAPEDEGAVRSLYFQSFEGELEQRGVPPPTYDEDRMERAFRPLQYATVCSRVGLDLAHVRAAFSIPPEYEIERPEADEVPFKPRAGGWIALPLAQLRLGLRFPLHKFVYHLLQNCLCCSLYQLAPNALWTILCFIVRCAELGISPTTRLFLSLFRADSTGSRPIFSFTWREKRFGERWAENDSSHRLWHFEWIWIRGGDLAWLPFFKMKIVVDLPRIDIREGSKLLAQIRRFTKTYNGRKWEPRLFHDNHFLHYFNCESLYFVVQLHAVFAVYFICLMCLVQLA